jgi:hypothetical protein
MPDIAISNSGADIGKIPLIQQGSDPASIGGSKWWLYMKAGGLYIESPAGVVTGPLEDGTHNHAASEITSGTLALARGGTNATLAATGPGLLQQASNGANVSVLMYKFDATAAPTAGDDVGDGYAVGSLWIDLTGDQAYICVDPTLATAVWLPLGGDVQPIKVKNTSGATAAVNEVGYINTAGEYKTTTTAGDDDIAWCAVLYGGANNADIYVARRGRVTIKYTGSAPASGDFLVTSTVAGQAQGQSYATAAVFARCIAAGSGGTVSAILMTQRYYLPLAPSSDLYAVASMSDSDFTATINGAPSGASVVYNAPSTGAESCIDPTNSNQLAKLVLYNSTRGNYALISDVNTATNTITLTANAPANWVSGDTITIRSTTNTDTISSGYFVDLELGDTTTVPDTAFALDIAVHNLSDTGASQQALYLHPYETGVQSKRQRTLTDSTASSQTAMPPTPLLLINRRFEALADASGSGTLSYTLRLRGAFIVAA